MGPLSSDQRCRVLEQVAIQTTRAGRALDIRLAEIRTRFDLSGTAAGMFCHRAGESWLRFNPWMFNQNFDRHLHDTVIHEVAHYGIHSCYPNRRLKPHGPQWRALMRTLGAEPSATFRADLTGVPVRRQNRHTYTCNCRDHEVSTTRHNRMRAGRAEYRCLYCQSVLRFTPAS